MKALIASEPAKTKAPTVAIKSLKGKTPAVAGFALAVITAFVVPDSTLEATESNLHQNGEHARTAPAHLALVAPYLGPAVNVLKSKVINILGTGAELGEAARILVDTFTDAGESTCAEFRPTEEALAAWLIHIRTVPEQFLVNELYSPCKLMGRVITHTDVSVAFSVQSSGVGTVSLFGKETVVFAPPGWTDPNAGLYFNSGE